MAKEITKIIKLQINAGAANPSPPVGPALGQAGVNIMAFCKELKAAGVASGSGEPNKKKVATLSKAKLMEVVNTKLPDLNTKDPERAARILAGQARQMGIEVEGM